MKVKAFLSITIISFIALAKVNATSIVDIDTPVQELKYSDEGGLQQDGMEPELSEYPELEEDIIETQGVESDSSYYSVNKFNILLYFVYKLKYGEEDIPVED